MGLPARFIGIITSPRDTFRAVAAHPTWLGMLVVVTVVMACFAALPMTTEAGTEAGLRSQIEGMESFGLAMTDIFLIWYLLVLAIGLGVLYRRRTQPVAWTLYGIYAVCVLVLAAVMSRVGGA